MNALNLDPVEISKFDALAADWWNPQGHFRTLHAINPLRLNYINQHAPLKGKIVLDVGCGGGILAESMARAGAHVTAIDMSQTALDAARQHASNSEFNIHYHNQDIETLSQQTPATFDVISCMEMLEHVPDPVSIVHACAQLCKPGGSIFFSTLNRNLKSFLLAIVAAEYLLQMIPRGTHAYGKFIKPAELASWARQAELQLNHISGIEYHPFTAGDHHAHYRLSRRADINYIMWLTKP